MYIHLCIAIANLKTHACFSINHCAGQMALRHLIEAYNVPYEMNVGASEASHLHVVRSVPLKCRHGMSYIQWYRVWGRAATCVQHFCARNLPTGTTRGTRLIGNDGKSTNGASVDNNYSEVPKYDPKGHDPNVY